MKELLNIQSELKAPKGQYNSFGKYKYRSAEDILEAVKPLCIKYDCELTLSDEIVYVGERYYIKATAKLEHEGSSPVIVTAYAREAQDKKGMDESQITGTASSYARKYALNGLFCIDDTKDADTMGYTSRTKGADTKSKKPEPMTREQIEDKIVALCDAKRLRVSDLCKASGVAQLSDLPDDRIKGCLAYVQGL